MAGEYSGDHRHGPLCVPGDDTLWGKQWMPSDPEPWPGFSAVIDSISADADQVYVFVHQPATKRPTTSEGRGSYHYWSRCVIAGKKCYVEERWEEGSWGENIFTIHIAPVGESDRGNNNAPDNNTSPA